MKRFFTFFIFISTILSSLNAQQSVAREWNEVLLDAIRVDVGRPTVHARNLFHISGVMYDAWAAFDDVADPFLLGKTVGSYSCNFDGIDVPSDPIAKKAAQEEAISFAAYRLLKYRFKNSPGAGIALPKFDSLMVTFGYDTSFVSLDYSGGSAAALGNYIAFSCMEFGLVDHSDEEINYGYNDAFYTPINPPLNPLLPGNPNIVDLNHWQPLAINTSPAGRFLSPQWGAVTPFALTENELTVNDINGNEYDVYLDPGAPPHIDSSGTLNGLEDFYKWNFALNAVWSGHLDPTDSVYIDISPNSVGHLTGLPTSEEEFRTFYNFIEGGVIDTGYTINPVTGQPYVPQIVPLGDFARVLAEFWADGPKSETPPGHWFTILNYVSDYPGFEKKFEGIGPVLDDLEWDVKAYISMAGAVHDVAVAVWGIKSYYDYVRPISAIRGMAELGQSSDSTKMSYHAGGLPLIDGHIALVEEGDELAGTQNENVGKIKLYAWRGPSYIADPATSFAGVGWILADNWWPYQRPSFVTPSFAGYVSGHSTFSRAAAEVMTLLTGDPYFPGGMGVFDAPKNNYLVFEQGPSVDMELQWATYRDASDQASLSRLWGGIHPPIDDVPGRKIGQKIGPMAFNKAKEYFNGQITTSTKNGLIPTDITVMQNFPNPASEYTEFEYSVRKTSHVKLSIYDMNGSLIERLDEGVKNPGVYRKLWNRNPSMIEGLYVYRLETAQGFSLPRKLIIAGN